MHTFASPPMCATMRTVVTAGDLIRDALAAGESQLGLAKKLADATRGPDVERWRYIVMRAARGGEPQAENVARVATTFGVDADDLLGRPARTARADRLAALEAEVADLRVALDAARRAHKLLLRRVAALEAPQSQREAPATRHGRRGT